MEGRGRDERVKKLQIVENEEEEEKLNKRTEWLIAVQLGNHSQWERGYVRRRLRSTMLGLSSQRRISCSGMGNKMAEGRRGRHKNDKGAPGCRAWGGRGKFEQEDSNDLSMCNAAILPNEEDYVRRWLRHTMLGLSSKRSSHSSFSGIGNKRGKEPTQGWRPRGKIEKEDWKT